MNRDTKKNSRKCEICKIDILRASYVKHLRSKHHLENEKHEEVIITEWLFQEPVESKIEKIYNPKSLKQIARDNFKIDDKQLNKELADKMNDVYYFTDRKLKVGFKSNLDSHDINHANSKLTITPKYPEVGIDVRYNNKIKKELSVIYAKITNQYKFKYQTVFSARFDKQDEDIQVIAETEFFIIIHHNLTESDLD